MWCVGENASAWWVRLPSLIAGVVSVPLAGLCVQRWGAFAQRCAMALIALSYFMVHYSTEARGYSLAILMSLTGYRTLDRFLERRQLVTALLFGLCVIAGILSHLSFLQFYLPALFWSVHRLRTDDPRRFAKEMAALHLLPVIAMIGLYGIDVRHLEIGGGPSIPRWQIVLQTLSLSLGGPSSGGWAWISAATFCALLIGCVWALQRSGDPAWKFFACLLVLFLGVRGLLLPAPFLYPRYFLILVALAYLVVAYGLSQIVTRWTGGRWLVAHFAACVLMGQSVQLGSLYALGRGQYGEACAFIDAASGTGEVRIGNDHPFRNEMVLRYHAQRRGITRFRYLDPQEDGVRADWLLIHSFPSLFAPCVPQWFDPSGTPLDEIVCRGQTYKLARSFPTADLSGMVWHCYRTVASSTGNGTGGARFLAVRGGLDQRAHVPECE